MYVEVKGVQFVNKGAELMLYAVLQQLNEGAPGAKVVLEPGVNSPFEKRMQVGALQKFSVKKGRFDLNKLSYFIPKKLRHWAIRSFGVITEADIDVVLDASGFAYGDQWPAIKTKHLCGEILRAHKKGAKYILLPQALGPFTRKQDRELIANAFPKATRVFAREATSKQHVSDITGETDNLIGFGDFTNLVHPIVDPRWESDQRTMLIIPNYNMVSPRNSDKRWQQHYVELMVNAIKIGVERGLKPLILNHEGGEDEKICRLIRDNSGVDIEIYHEDDSRRVKGIISKAEIVVCSRFHGCVSALCQGIPCLGTSWSHKYERLFEEYGLSACLLEPTVTPEELAEKIEFALQESVGISQQARENFKLQSQKLWDNVFNAIN